MDQFHLVLIFCVAGCLQNAIRAAKLPIHGGRVLHGTIGQRHAYPYMVKIEPTFNITDNDGIMYQSTLICSGSILTPKLVLSAAHCFQFPLDDLGRRPRKEKLERVEVEAGTKFKYNDPITFQSRGARKIITLPEYDHSLPSITSQKYDVALVILDSSLDFNEEVNQIAVLSREDEDKMLKDMEEGLECLVLGFGQSGKDAGALRGDTTYLLTNDECKRKHCIRRGKDSPGCKKNYLAYRQICTFNKDTSTCAGDSGGPLVCDKQIYGVLSYGITGPNKMCLPAVPNVYTNMNAIHMVRNLLFRNTELWELSRHPKYKTEPNAPERAHPFVVEVRVYSGDNQEWGQYTGTIISTNIILTACHCVKEDDDTIVEESEVEVFAGAEPYIQTAKAKHIITHPTCTRKLLKTGKKGRYVFENDVAFLVLQANLRFGELVKSIGLGPPEYEMAWTEKKVECQVYGYGMTKPYRYNEPPLKTVGIGTVWLLEEKRCQKRLCSITRSGDELCTRKDYYNSGWLCGLSDDTVGCFGHTGGPVVCNGLVHGVDSYLLPCKERKCKSDEECYDWPSIFTNSLAISQLFGIIKNNKTLLT